MIKEVRSNNPKFKTVTFNNGFNVVLADRSNVANDKDSRNGLGKSSLLNVIHFLLGNSPKRDSGLRKKELCKWDYSMTFTINGKEYTAKRNPENLSNIYVKGDFSNWSIQPEYDSDKKSYFYKNTEWTILLGNRIFDLPIEPKEKYHPNFRGLISFFAREGVDAYYEPFQHMGRQLEWDKQVQNAYLLNLNYDYPIRLQYLKDKDETLRQLKNAAEQGLLGEFIGSVGDLEAERVRLTEAVTKLDAELKDFNIHPEYRAIQREANEITKMIQDELNERNLSEQLLKRYKENLSAEMDISVKYVEDIYKDVGLQFPDKLSKSLEEIRNFHSQVIRNRKDYLTSEIKKIEKRISVHDISIKSQSDKRRDLMLILQTHGALDEHFKLQQRLFEKQQALSAVTNKILNLRKFQEGKSDLKIEKEDLLKRMRRDFGERKDIVDEAIKYFNQNSQALYNESGNLSIDVADTGYKFKVDIMRSASQGINVMKILCYDLTLAELRANKLDSPGFLIHDSTIFDGVDERQIAKGLERAYELSSKWKFQYICTLNSDIIPYKEFSSGFTEKFEKSICLRLDDSTNEGGLFGFRF